MTEKYNTVEQNRRDDIQLISEAIPNNLNEGNVELAAVNWGRIAENSTDLGLLHWRHGLDPRPDFDDGMAAYERMSVVARENALPKNISELPIVYAMLSIMGRETPIEFEDEDYHQSHRWPCYECCLVHALHNQPLNERHATLLNRYLAKNNGLGDRTILTYFELLGLRPSDQSREDLVSLADANWAKRRNDKFFSDGGPAYVGAGIMNDIYVDIYLAAVLQKIGWPGDSIHRWKW